MIFSSFIRSCHLLIPKYSSSNPKVAPEFNLGEFSSLFIMSLIGRDKSIYKSLSLLVGNNSITSLDSGVAYNAKKEAIFIELLIL